MTHGVKVPENLRFESLEQRSIYGRLLYYELYLWKLENAPKDIDRFCDPNIDENLRETLIKWIRFENKISKIKILRNGRPIKTQILDQTL
jgi:hypothetical protein